MKKLFTIGVVLTTILWTMGVAAFIPVASATALEPGDLIMKDDGSSTAVYFYAADGDRYMFSTANTYFSWYEGFDAIKKIDVDDLAAIDLAGNILARPGSNLIEFESVAGVYAVEPEGLIREVPADVAEALYGADWADMVVLIQDGFYSDYTEGDALAADAYAEGTLVQVDSTVYYVNADGSWSPVEDEDAFDANGWNWDYVITAAIDMPSEGAAITEATYNDTSQGGGTGEPTTGGPLTISLSSDTPATTPVPQNTVAEFVKFDLEAGSDDVNVTSIRLDSYGLGTATEIDSVTMYAGGSKVGTSKNISAEGYATFNFATPILVEANTTKELTVKAKISTASTAGEMYGLGIESADYMTTDASSVSGSFPVNGNQMSSIAGVTVGTLTFDAADNDTTAYIGQDDVSLVEFTVAEGNVEDVNFRGLTLKNNGNLKGNEMGTMVLLWDGTEIATANMDDDKYVTFSFDDVLIKKGQTESFEVRGDIDAGSASDTIQLYIKDDTDVDAVGALYGYTTAVTKTAFATGDGASTEITVAAGQMAINWDGTEVPAADIETDTDNLIMGQIDLVATDEPLKITALSFTVGGIDTGDDEVENTELYDLDTGGIIDLTYVDATGVASTDEEIYIPAGSTKSYNFRLDTTTTADDGDVYYVTLASSGITAEGETSGATITSITPSSITSKNMTIVASALTHQAKTINAVNAIAGGDKIAVLKGELKTSTSSNIKLTKVIFEDNFPSATSAFHDDNITLAQLVINDSVVKELSGQIAESTTAESVLTFSGLSYWLDAGTTSTMYLKLSFADTFSGTYTTAYALNVRATTGMEAKDEDSDTVNPTEADTAGPTVTLRSAGALNVYGSITDAGANRDLYITGGTTSGLLGALKFDANYEDVLVKDLTLYTLDDADVADDIERVELVDDDKSTVLATSTDFTYGDYDGDADINDLKVLFDEWGYRIENEAIKTVYVRTVTKGIGTGAEDTGDSAVDMAWLIQAATATGADTGTAITCAAIATVVDNATSQFDNDFVTKTGTTQAASITAITNTLTNGILTNSDPILGKYKITVDGGTNTDDSGNDASIDLTTFNVTFNYNGVAFANGNDLTFYLESDPNTTVTVDADPATGVAEDVDISALGGITDEDTLVIKAVGLTGAGAAGDFLQSKIDDLSASFDYDVNNTGTDYTAARLPYTSVTGGYLSN